MTAESIPSGTPDGSVFLRITDIDRGKGSRVVASLIEVDAEGWIPREVDVTADGTPVRVTRPGDYGYFNDSPIPNGPPGLAQFEKNWGADSVISREEFEAVYARADSELPASPPIDKGDWLPCLVILLIVVLAVLMAVVSLVGGIFHALIG